MILITGGRGFVGKKLIESLRVSKAQFVSLVRNGSENLESFEMEMPNDPSCKSLLSLAAEFNKPIDTVIHCAGLAHGKLPNASYQDYERVNVSLTEELAKLALTIGATKFIFLSTIGVHGRVSNQPISESSLLAPYDDYSRSKLNAEQRLVDLFEGEERGSELVIIRPPLIIGEGAPGNFGKLIKLCSSAIPLPFGLINNKRTVLSLENLVDFIFFAKEKTGVSGFFTLADDEVLSTKDMAKEIKSSLGRGSFMLPVPKILIKALSFVVRKPHFYEQLCGDLVVDNSKSKSYGWRPTVDSRSTLRKTAKLFVNEERSSQ